MRQFRCILRRAAFTLLGVWALAAGSATVAPAKMLTQAYVGVWSIEAYTNRDGGAFDYCTMSAEYDDGVSLIFFLDHDFLWGIALVGTKWKLTIGDKYDVKIHVDKGNIARHVAEVLSEQWVDIPLDDREELFDELREGRTLYIDTPGKAFYFGLNGTSRGLAALYDCVDKRTREASQTNPFEAPAGEQDSGTSSANPFGASTSHDNATYKVEAERMMADLLQEAQIGDYTMADLSNTSDNLQRFASAWKNSAGLIGGLFVIPQGEKEEAEHVLNTIARGEAKSCRGKFVSKTDMSARARGAYMPRAYAGCSDGGQSTMMYISAFQRRQGGFYVVFTGSMAGHSPNAAAEADDRIREAALSVR